MKTIKINVPLTVHYELLPPPVDGEAVQKRIESRWGAVTVTISGSREAVDHMLSVCSTNNPPTLIQRALSALGYVVGDHEKDVAQFSQWVDYLAEFPQSEEALELWTNATLARLHAIRSVDEASKDAQTIVVQRMRLFPPAPKMGLDDGPPLPEPWAELQEWRSAAKRCGIESAKELAGTVAETFGQFVDRKIVREWQEVTGCETPEMARMKIGSCDESIAEARSAERSAWQAATNSYSPNEAKFSAEQRERAWCDATNRTCPGDAEQRIEDLQLQTKMQAETVRQWQAATERQTPELAKTHISQLENRNAGLLRDIVAWQKATGASDPDGAIARARADLDAWKDATGAADTHSAYKRIQELESKLLSYAGEIDALRKASSTMVRDPALEMRACDAEHEKRVSAERELAKVRAELQSKCREAQTAKERADENAREMVKRGALLDKIAEALGCDFNHESLPEHVADMKRAYDNVNDCLVGPDNLVNETKEIASILVSQIKDAGIESAAGAIAGRSVHLSVSWAKTMQAREILLASPGESIVDAAKRTMDRCANLEGQIVADDNRTDELRKILHAKEGESIVDAAKRAIIPLPKPEKVEPGQRWAVVSNVGYVYGSATGDYPVDLSNVGIIQEKRILASIDWIYIGK